MSDGIILIYGKKKIGKTSLANEFSENMFHMMVEPMARALKIYQQDCVEYEDVVGYTKVLASGNHSFDSVSLDPLPLFYERSLEYTGRVKGFEHPGGQNDYGLSWSHVKRDFTKALLAILALPIGCMFHAHEVDDEIETRDGDKFKIVRPEGGTQVKEFIDANVENIWYYHMRGEKRFLQVRGDGYVTACTAWTDKFYTPSGEQVMAVPMGKSPKEGYDNLIHAFNNKQKETYETKKGLAIETESEKKTVKRVTRRINK